MMVYPSVVRDGVVVVVVVSKPKSWTSGRPSERKERELGVRRRGLPGSGVPVVVVLAFSIVDRNS